MILFDFVIKIQCRHTQRTIIPCSCVCHKSERILLMKMQYYLQLVLHAFCRKLNPMFEGNFQQDAHELLRCLLAYVQDATKAVNKHRKNEKMAAAAARIAPPATATKGDDVNAAEEMARIVAAAVHVVMSSPKPSDADGDHLGGSCHKEMISDVDSAMKCMDIKQELENGVTNGFKDQVSCKLNNDHSLEHWVNKSFTNHVVAGSVSLTNGWDETLENHNQSLAYGSTVKCSEKAKLGNGILATSVALVESQDCKNSSSLTSHLSTLTRTLNSLVNGEDENENSAIDLNGSADFEAQADMLSNKLMLLTQSKSDTNIGCLTHQRNNRWRSSSAGDVRSCGHVTKRRRTRGSTMTRGSQPGIIDMFTRQITIDLTNGINGDDHDPDTKPRLLGEKNGDGEISATTSVVSKKGIVDNESETEAPPARYGMTQNKWQQMKIIKKQTARKSAGGLRRLSLKCHVNGSDRNRNRWSTIHEDEIDCSTRPDSPGRHTRDEVLKSVALANEKVAVVELDKSAVSNYLEEVVARQQVVDHVEVLFQGSMALRTRCLECEGFTERKEAYQDIGVPVRNERRDDDEEEEEDEDEPGELVLE